MARQPLSLNFKALNAELHESDKNVDPLLVAAKITTIKVDGKDVPAHDAPLPARIAALGALLATGDKTVDDANLIAANGQLAAQVEDLTAKLTSVNATLAAQSQKLTDTEGKLTVATANVTSLTAKVTELTNLLDAGNKENARLLGVSLADKTELARLCLAAGCVEVAKDGTPEAKLAEALKLTHGELLTSYRGAVNAAVAKAGVVLEHIPATGGNANGSLSEKKLTATEKCQAAVAAKNRK